MGYNTYRFLVINLDVVELGKMEHRAIPTDLVDNEVGEPSSSVSMTT